MSGRSRWMVWLWAAAPVVLGACDGSSPTDVQDPVVAVEVDPQQVSLLVGDTARLIARALRASEVRVAGVAPVWASEAPEHAASGDGGPGDGGRSRQRRHHRLGGRQDGRATIEAADIAAEGTATVTAVSPAPGGGESGLTFVVRPAPQPPPGEVASVEIDVDSLALEEGAVVQLTATPRDSNGQPVPGPAIIWTSSDPEVATVGTLGTVTGIRSDAVTVTARVRGIEASTPARVSSGRTTPDQRPLVRPARVVA